jgi:hypothetical protein
LSKLSEKEEVKVEARGLTSMISQFQDKDDENTTEPPTKDEMPIMRNFDKFEDSSKRKASSATTCTLLTIGRGEVSK